MCMCVGSRGRQRLEIKCQLSETDITASHNLCGSVLETALLKVWGKLVNSV